MFSKKFPSLEDLGISTLDCHMMNHSDWNDAYEKTGCFHDGLYESRNKFRPLYTTALKLAKNLLDEAHHEEYYDGYLSALVDMVVDPTTLLGKQHKDAIFGHLARGHDLLGFDFRRSTE